MKILIPFLIFSITALGQTNIEATLIDQKNIETQNIVSISNFKIAFYTKDAVLYNNDGNKTSSYSNVQLGEISSANAFNNLKINLFYKDFNTAIILDNRLAEIFKIDFNRIQPYINVSHISTGNDNTIWVFNQDTQQLALFDYITNKTRANTLPIATQLMDLKSNYNYCWLLSKEYLYQFNYFGSLTKKIKNENFTAITENNGNLIAQRGKELYYLKKGSDIFVKIDLPELLIKQFLLTNETLYIYANESLLKFQLK